jgi:hypothetical protein
MRRLGRPVSVNVALAYICLMCRGTGLQRRVVGSSLPAKPKSPTAGDAPPRSRFRVIGLDLRRRVWPDDDYRPLIRCTWPDRDVGPPLASPSRARLLHDARLPPSPPRAHSALPNGAAASRVLAGGEARSRPRRCIDPPSRRARAAWLPRVPDPRLWLRPRVPRHLWPRLPGRLLLQGPRPVPVLHHPAQRPKTAAHLVEHALPQVPVRQWVVTFPKRLRFFLHRDPVLLGRVRRSVLRRAVRHGALTPEVAADLARWGHGGGFSLHAAVLSDAVDRPGLERARRADALAAASPPSLRRRVRRPTDRPASPRPARPRSPRTPRPVRLRVRSVPMVGLHRCSVRPELPLRSDPELISHPSALLLLRRRYSALTPRCRQRRRYGATSAPASSFTPAHPLQTPEAAHPVAWITAHRPRSLPERNQRTRTRALR